MALQGPGVDGQEAAGCGFALATVLVDGLDVEGGPGLQRHRVREVRGVRKVRRVR